MIFDPTAVILFEMDIFHFSLKIDGLTFKSTF